MERNGRRAAAAVFLRAPVPLTSRQEEDRYWCDPGGPDVRSLARGARLYGLHRFSRSEDKVDVGWCCVDLRSGH